jgi:hypothetical protein
MFDEEIRKISVMKSVTFVQTMVVAVLLGVAAWAPAAERLGDPSDSYLRASVLCQDGMKAADAGNRETAMSKLMAAQTLIQKIHQSQPNWQPALVAYRLQKIENVLKDLAQAEAQTESAAKTVVASP